MHGVGYTYKAPVSTGAVFTQDSCHTIFHVSAIYPMRFSGAVVVSPDALPQNTFLFLHHNVPQLLRVRISLYDLSTREDTIASEILHALDPSGKKGTLGAETLDVSVVQVS